MTPESTFFFEAGFLTGLEFTELVNARDLSVYTDLVLGLQLHTTVPGFHMGTGDGLQVLVFVQQVFYSLNHLPSLNIWHYQGTVS